MAALRSHSFDVAKALRFLGKPRGEVFFGVELEMEWVYKEKRPVRSGASDAAWNRWDRAENAWCKKRQSFISDLIEGIEQGVMKDFALCKSDGSVQNGLEIVTAPASLLLHRKKWGKFWEEVAASRLSLQPSSACGMHVHISKKPLTLEQRGWMHHFLNVKENRKFVEKIAGRGAGDYTKFIPKPLTKVNPESTTHTTMPSFHSNILPHDGGEFPAGRYEALNMLPPHTMEMRIFASPATGERFFANLEFCAALTFWCKGGVRGWTSVHSMKDLEASRFIAWVREEREKDFPVLKGWLDDENLS